MNGEPNLRSLKPSRKSPRPGDIFAMLPPDGKYLFGRVIATDAAVFAIAPLVLIYIFQARDTMANVPEPQYLVPSGLLVPPIMTNRMAWSRGYFQTLVNREVLADEVLDTHCFLGPPKFGQECYYDEHSNLLPGPVPPVGEWGLHSFRSIDNLVSDALGIARAPQWEPGATAS